MRAGSNYTEAHTGDHAPGASANGEHLVAFSPVQPFGWGLVLEESWEEIASPLLRATQSAPLILAPVLLLAIVALWFGARQIVQPLQSLEKSAGQLAAGDFAAIRQPVGGISEIRHLQDALVETAAALEAAQAALHGYIGALTAGLENERRALARELHDDTLQALIALNQHVQLAALHARADTPAGPSGIPTGPLPTAAASQKQDLLDLQGQVGQTIHNLRRAIGGLRPIYLEDLGLVAALRMLVRETEQIPGDPSRGCFPAGGRRAPPHP